MGSGVATRIDATRSETKKWEPSLENMAALPEFTAALPKFTVLEAKKYLRLKARLYKHFLRRKNSSVQKSPQKINLAAVSLYRL